MKKLDKEKLMTMVNIKSTIKGKYPQHFTLEEGATITYSDFYAEMILTFPDGSVKKELRKTELVIEIMGFNHV